MTALQGRTHVVLSRAERRVAGAGRPWAAFLIFAALGACCVSASEVQAQELAEPPGVRVANLTPRPGFFNEPSIAVNPANPQQLVAAFQVKASVAYSVDGGLHWALAEGVAPRDYKISGDVSIAFDARGHAILCYIAFDKLGTANYWGHNATRNGIFIRRSLDGGKTWESNAIAVDAQPTKPGAPFEDKPYIVADNSRGPYAGNLYVGWTQFSLTKSVILFSRSADGGLTWAAPRQISTHDGLPRDDNGSVEGFTGAVGSDSALYAVWADGNEIVFTSSRDGGQNFEVPRKILDVAPPYFHIEGVDRANGFPEIAVDPRTNRLFVTWSDYRNGDVDVFCSVSNDRGRTWSAPVRVNSDPVHNGADQFFQWLAVDPLTGAANVVFYDRRDDPANREARIVLARSTDGGKTFPNYAWTQKGFDPRGDFIGDYTGIAAFGDHVYGIWTEEEFPAGAKSKPAGVKRPSLNPADNPKAHHTIVRVGLAQFPPGNN